MTVTSARAGGAACTVGSGPVRPAEIINLWDYWDGEFHHGEPGRPAIAVQLPGHFRVSFMPRSADGSARLGRFRRTHLVRIR
jgi:hypothetical protein